MEEERELLKEMRIEWVNCQGNLVNISWDFYNVFYFYSSLVACVTFFFLIIFNSMELGFFMVFFFFFYISGIKMYLRNKL